MRDQPASLAAVLHEPDADLSFGVDGPMGVGVGVGGIVVEGAGYGVLVVTVLVALVLVRLVVAVVAVMLAEDISFPCASSENKSEHSTAKTLSMRQIGCIGQSRAHSVSPSLLK